MTFQQVPYAGVSLGELAARLDTGKLPLAPLLVGIGLLLVLVVALGGAAARRTKRGNLHT
ncbi:MAG: hypothetical protein U0514_02855 [Candidatus Andersenbacteria bacterium]